MLYTRHLEPQRRDHELALGWINEAIVISSLLPDEKERSFNLVFNRNGLALVYAHQGRPELAQALLEYAEAARLGSPFPELFYNPGRSAR